MTHQKRKHEGAFGKDKGARQNSSVARKNRLRVGLKRQRMPGYLDRGSVPQITQINADGKA